MFFADLRGWTSFADTVEPEELMRVLGEFHGAIGRLVKRFDATVDFFAGRRPALFSTTRSRSRTRRSGRCGPDARCARRWRSSCRSGRSVDTTSTSAWASLSGTQRAGEVGFEGRSDYAAIGVVTNLASRLADEANGGRVLISQRLYAEVEPDVEVEPASEFTLKGFGRPVAAFDVVAVRPP